MYTEFFAKSPLLALPVVALVIFIAVFALIIVRAIRRGADVDQAEARLPFDAPEEVHHA